MRKRFERFFGKNSLLVMHAGLVAICIGVIVYFMPREKLTSYSYSHNAPWNHEQIIADFDFIVKKSDKQIVAERDSIRKNFRPFFTYNDKLTRQASRA